MLPKLIYEHNCKILYISESIDSFPESSFLASQAVYLQNTQDLGLNRLTEKISGKNPWYDSYEDYYVDIKTLSNDNMTSYSKIPEFKISEQISQLGLVD